MSRQHGDYGNACEHQKIPKKRRLLLDSTVADDSLLQYGKTDNWWKPLNEDSEYTESNFFRNEGGNFSSRRSGSVYSVHRSIAENECDSVSSRVTSGSGFSCNNSDNTIYPSGFVRVQRRHRRQARFSPSDFKIAVSGDTTIAQDPSSYRYGDANKSSFVADLSIDVDSDSKSENIGEISRNVKSFKYARLKRDQMVRRHNEINEFECDSVSSRVTSGSGFTCNISDNTIYPSGSVRVQRRHRRQARFSPSDFKITLSGDTTIAQDPSSYRYSDTNKSSSVADLSIDVDSDSKSENIGEISRNVKNFKYARLKRDRMVRRHSEINEFETVLNDITVNDSENRVQNCPSEDHVDAEDAGVDEVSHLISSEKSCGAPAALTYCRQIVTHGGKVEGTTYTTISEVKDKIIYQQQKSCPRGKRRVIPDGVFTEAMSEFSFENNIEVEYPEVTKAKEFDETDGELSNIHICTQSQSNFNSEKYSCDEDVSEVLNRSGPRLSDSNVADEIDVPHLKSHRKKRRRERKAISENVFAKILEDGTADISKNLSGTEINVSKDQDASISHEKSHKIHKDKNYDCMNEINIEEIAHDSYLIKPEEVRVEDPVSGEIENQEASKSISRLSRCFSDKTPDSDSKSRFISVANISDEIESFNTVARRRRSLIKAIPKNAFDAVLGDGSSSDSSSSVEDFNGSKEKLVTSVLGQAIPETVQKSNSNIIKDVMEGSVHGSSPIRSKELNIENVMKSEAKNQESTKLRRRRSGIENREPNKSSLSLSKRLSNENFDGNNSKSRFNSSLDITDEVDTYNVGTRRKRDQIKTISKYAFDAVLGDESMSKSHSPSAMEVIIGSKEKSIISILVNTSPEGIKKNKSDVIENGVEEDVHESCIIWKEARPENTVSDRIENQEPSKSISRLSRCFSDKTLDSDSKSRFISVANISDEIDSFNAGVRKRRNQIKPIPKNAFDAVLGDEFSSDGSSAVEDFNGSKEKLVTSVLDQAIPETVEKNNSNIVKNDMEGSVCMSSPIRSKELNIENVMKSEAKNQESTKLSECFSNENLDYGSKSHFISATNIVDEIESFTVRTRRRRNQIKAIMKSAFDAAFEDESVSECHGSSAVEAFDGLKEKKMASVSVHKLLENSNYDNSHVNKEGMEKLVNKEISQVQTPKGNCEIENLIAQNQEFDINSLISVPCGDSVLEVVDNQVLISKQRSKLKEVLSKHQGAFTAELHGASLSGSDSSHTEGIDNASPGENSQSNLVLSERIEKDCIAVIDNNMGTSVHPSRAEIPKEDNTNYKKTEGNELGFNKQKNLEGPLQDEDMLPDNESKAENLENNSLSLFKTPLQAKQGIGESTRGFIVTRDKSPYSLFLKHFGDMSSIMGDSVGENDSRDSERNNTLTDSKSKKLVELPNSKTALQDLDNEIEALRWKSPLATVGDFVVQEWSHSFTEKEHETESHAMKKFANSDVKSFINEMVPFEIRIASPKELLMSEVGLAPVSAVTETEITETDISEKSGVEIMASNTEHVLESKSSVATVSAFHPKILEHKIDSFNNCDGDRAKTDEQDVSKFRVSSLLDDDTVTNNPIELNDGTRKVGSNVDKNESLKSPCEGAEVPVSHLKAVVESTATEMAVYSMEFNGGSHKVDPTFDQNQSYKSPGAAACCDSNFKAVVESKAVDMAANPVKLNNAFDGVSPNIDIDKSFKSPCEGIAVSILNLQTVIESTASQMAVNLVGLKDGTDENLEKNGSFKSPNKGVAVSVSNIESTAAEMEINPEESSDGTDGNVDENNSFKSPSEGAVVYVSNLQKVTEPTAAGMKINSVELNDGNFDKKGTFKSPCAGAAISVTNLQVVAQSAVTEVVISQVEFNDGSDEVTPNVAKNKNFKSPGKGVAVSASNLLAIIESTGTEMGINDLTFVKSIATDMTSTPRPTSVPLIGDKVYIEAVSAISSINELSDVKSAARDISATFPEPEVDDMPYTKHPSASSINEVTFIKSNFCNLSTIPEQVSKASLTSELASVTSPSNGMTIVASNGAVLPSDPQGVYESSSGKKANVKSANALGISASCIKLPSPVFSVTSGPLTNQLGDKADDIECTQHLRASSINELTFIKSNVCDLLTITDQISKLSENSELIRVASPSKEITFAASNAPALFADPKSVSKFPSGNKANTESSNAVVISNSMHIKPAPAYSATSEPATAQSDDSELLTDSHMIKELTFTISTAPGVPPPQLVSKHSIGENRNVSLLSGSKAINELTFVKSAVENLPINPNRDSEPLHVGLEAADQTVNSSAFNELSLSDPVLPKPQMFSKLDISNLESILSDQISEAGTSTLSKSLEEKSTRSNKSDKHFAPQQILGHSVDGTFIVSKSVAPKSSNSTFSKLPANLKHFQDTFDSELLQLSPLNIDLLNMSIHTSSINSEAQHTNLPSTKELTVSEVLNEEAGAVRSCSPRKSGSISPVKPSIARGSSTSSSMPSIATESDTCFMTTGKVVESDISSTRPRDSCFSSVTYSSLKESDGASFRPSSVRMSDFRSVASSSLKESDGASLRPSSVRMSDFSSVASSSARVSVESLSTPIKKSYKYFSTPSEEERKVYDDYLAKMDDMVAQRKQQDMVILRKIFPKDNLLKEQNQRLQNHRKPQHKRKKEEKKEEKREDEHFEENCSVKRRKLPRWVAKDLRALVEEAMEERGKCFIDAEEFLYELVDRVKNVMTSKKGWEVRQGVQKIQEQLFELNIIRTLSDFYGFVRNYLPLEFRHRSIPCTGKNKEIHPQWNETTQLDKTIFRLNK